MPSLPIILIVSRHHTPVPAARGISSCSMCNLHTPQFTPLRPTYKMATIHNDSNCPEACWFNPMTYQNNSLWNPEGPCFPCAQDPITVSPSMVNFLNLTGDTFTLFFQAYCLNPTNDDGCPFGYCPNPDAAGEYPLN